MGTLPLIAPKVHDLSRITISVLKKGQSATFSPQTSKFNRIMN
jgi:hypothetical protein